jgi:hypothetical protein
MKRIFQIFSNANIALQQSWTRHRYIWFLFAVIFLFCAFQANLFHGKASYYSYEMRDGFQIDSEDLATGFESGTLAQRLRVNYGLMGHIGEPYFSQMGIHGLVFQTVCSPFLNSADCKAIARPINVFLLSCLLVSLAFLYCKTADYRAWLLIIFFMGCSDWLMLFSKNLYWLVALQILPFVVAFWLTPKWLDGKISKLKFLTILFIAVALKAATGYEFISCTIASTAIPVIYFMLLKPHEKYLNVFRRAALICVVGSFALFSVIGINGIQNGFYFSSRPHEAWSQHNLELGYASIFARAKVRLLGKATEKAVDEESALVQGGVVPDHSNGFFLGTLDDYFRWSYCTFRLPLFGAVSLNFYWLLVFFSAWVVVFKWKRDRKPLRSERAFLLTLPFAFLASISWIFLALPHSMVHSATDPIVLYIPFLLFLFFWPAIVFATEKP